MAEHTPAETVRARVADADRLRRLRDESVRAWRVAPIAAGVCLALAGLGRWAGWSAMVPLAALLASAAVLAMFFAIVRRSREVSDSAAAALDARAALHGELHSAHWFVRHGTEDPWVDFHVTRAAERVQAVDWKALYPAPPATRARIAASVMALAALAIAFVGPGRTAALAGSAVPATAPADARKAGAPLQALPPELRKKLEDMLNAIETGRAGSLTGAEVRGLLAQLEKLRGGEAPRPSPRPEQARTDAAKPPSEADLKAFAERARRDSQKPGLEPEASDALKNISDDLSDAAAEARKQTPKELQDAVPSKEVQKGDAAKSSSSGENAAPGDSTKDASGAGNVGVVMMTSDSGGNGDPGVGAGMPGGRGQGEGRLPDLGAALRHETIEAGSDSTGDNLPTSVRRRTEHGNATIGYAHSAAAAAERGRSAAPPRVPEARRAAVRAYFIRKQ